MTNGKCFCCGTDRKKKWLLVIGDLPFLENQVERERTHVRITGWSGDRFPVWAFKRLNTAYLLKESFGQLWDYEKEGWARRFFENWSASLKWQYLAPYDDFALMIIRHWADIAAYCQPDNKVALGFVEGFNKKESGHPLSIFFPNNACPSFLSE
jgi:hypothetical protein